MDLAFLALLLGLPLTLALNDYTYFHDCGYGGWHCNKTSTGYRVIYKCGVSQPSARVWIWTARIPAASTYLGVEDCDSVQVHADCTAGIRLHNIRTFHIKNCVTVEILKPSSPMVYLHDNEAIPHMPEEVIFENVTFLKAYPGSFNEVTMGRCRSKVQLQKFTLKKTNIVNLWSQFKNKELKEFNLDRVRFVPMETIMKEKVVFNVTSNVTIINSEFFAANAFLYFRGNQVIFRNNFFHQNFFGQGNGVKVVTDYFLFENNTIEEMEKNSFYISTPQVQIINNTFQDIKEFAFENISPSNGITLHLKQFKFHLENNKFLKMEQFALQPSYEIYKKLCSDIIISKNELPCQCSLFNWSLMERHYLHLVSYYERFISQDNYHACLNSPRCPLARLAYETEPCNESSIIEKCSFEETTTITSTTTEIIKEFSHTEVSASLITETDSVTSSYLKESTSNGSILEIGLPVLVVVTTVGAILAMFHWYKKKRTQNIEMVTSYLRTDEETLITGEQ